MKASELIKELEKAIEELNKAIEERGDVEVEVCALTDNDGKPVVIEIPQISGISIKPRWE